MIFKPIFLIATIILSASFQKVQASLQVDKIAFNNEPIDSVGRSEVNIGHLIEETNPEIEPRSLDRELKDQHKSPINHEDQPDNAKLGGRMFDDDDVRIYESHYTAKTRPTHYAAVRFPPYPEQPILDPKFNMEYPSNFGSMCAAYYPCQKENELSKESTGKLVVAPGLAQTKQIEYSIGGSQYLLDNYPEINKLTASDFPTGNIPHTASYINGELIDPALQRNYIKKQPLPYYNTYQTPYLNSAQANYPGYLPYETAVPNSYSANSLPLLSPQKPPVITYGVNTVQEQPFGKDANYVRSLSGITPYSVSSISSSDEMGKDQRFVGRFL